MTDPIVAVLRLPGGAGLDLPAAATVGAAGFDLRAAVPMEKPVLLQPGQRELIPTGFRFAVPPGYELQIRPRSGLAMRHGVTVLNSPATIDCDYRGQVFVCLINHGEATFAVNRGDRIAQAVVASVPRIRMQEVDTLDETERGAGGFGSTGVD